MPSLGTRQASDDSKSKGSDEKLPTLDPRLDVTDVIPGSEEKVLRDRKKLLRDTVLEVKEMDVISHFSGVPKEHVETRRVRIYKPAQNTMQSGTGNTRKWRIEFENRERWENPLMGWASSGDPLSNISMTMYFASAEDAVRYCQRQGYTYFVDEPHVYKHPVKKSYAANFAWNKRTRTGNK